MQLLIRSNGCLHTASPFGGGVWWLQTRGRGATGAGSEAGMRGDRRTNASLGRARVIGSAEGEGHFKGLKLWRNAGSAWQAARGFCAQIHHDVDALADLLEK